MASRPAASTSSSVERPVRGAAVDRRRSGDEREIAHPPQQPAGNARRAPRAARDLVPAVRRDADAKQARAAFNNVFELRLGIEVQPDGNAEAVTQWVREKAGARCGANQGKSEPDQS